MPIRHATIFQCDGCGEEIAEAHDTLNDEERELPWEWMQAETGEVFCLMCSAEHTEQPADPDQVDLDPDTIPDHGLDY